MICWQSSGKRFRFRWYCMGDPVPEDENLKKACQMGICKLNISNDLKRGAIANLNEKCKDGMGAYAMYPLRMKATRTWWPII